MDYKPSTEDIEWKFLAFLLAQQLRRPRGVFQAPWNSSWVNILHIEEYDGYNMGFRCYT